MNISILGCGWLGLPLAKKFLEAEHSVKGSTTSRVKLINLQKEGIIPYHINLLPDGILGDLTAFLSDAEVLVIDIPPGLKKDPEADFVGRIKNLKTYIEKSAVKNTIFISSTSVYEDRADFPIYTENDVPTQNFQLHKAEQILNGNKDFQNTVIRFGGLWGPGRHPVKYLAGKKDIKDPDAPVNLIHQDDCIGIIEEVIAQGFWGETINAVYPNHPSKKEYYTNQAKKLNLDPPFFDKSTASKGKIIKSVKLQEKLQYKFKAKI